MHVASRRLQLRARYEPALGMDGFIGVLLDQIEEAHFGRQDAGGGGGMLAGLLRALSEA